MNIDNDNDSKKHETEMKSLANMGFGNCVLMKDVVHLDIVADELLKIGMETPRVEVSLLWENVDSSSLQLYCYEVL